MPLRMKNEWYEPVEKDISDYFFEVFYRDIINAVQESELITNTKNLLLDRIRSGKIQYKDGVFRGEFNVSISKELSKYAKYDGRTKTWKGFPPADVIAAASVANSTAQRLNDKLLGLINDIPSRLKATINDVVYSIEEPMFFMNEQADKDLVNLGISPNITPEMSRKLVEDYTTNQDLNIVNWEPEQVERLREMIQKNAEMGYNREELQKMIASEWGVSQNKARFLARQETSLFMSKLRDTRYQEAGVGRFRWSATGGKAGDGRTRDFHRFLHGKVFTYGNPPVIDDRTGETGYPGEAFGCRCVAIPVI